MLGKIFSVITGACLLSGAFAGDFDPYLKQAATAYQQAKHDKTLLKAWVADLPKGGDLHNHFTGAIYRPQLLKLIDQDPKQPNFCADMSSDKVTDDAQCIADHGEWVRDIQKGSNDYTSLIDAWTMKDFHYAAPNFGESHFFATFGEIGALTHDMDYYPQLLANLMRQAAREHLNYIEYMWNLDSYNKDGSAAHMGKQYLAHLDKLKTINQSQVNHAADLLIRKGLYSKVVLPNIIQPTQRLVADARQLLHCNSGVDQPKACQVTVRFQYQLTRLTSPSEVFASMVAGQLAHHYVPDLYVSENLVAPESNAKSIQYYSLQMQMLKYLNRYVERCYGQRMKLAEHAGELTANDTDNTNLHDHIYQAINVAGADRIGHGVDIGYELQSHPHLLKQMAQQHTLIEINLTSNQAILGVCDGKSYCMDASPAMKTFHHPLMMYVKHHVPVALSTDDQGVSNTSLNHEYFMAASRYPLSYQQFKNIDRNSLYYAFVEGDNLFVNDRYQQLVEPCHGDNPYKKLLPSKRCQRFLDANTKAQLQWRLEQQFARFEAQHQS